MIRAVLFDRPSSCRVEEELELHDPAVGEVVVATAAAFSGQADVRGYRAGPAAAGPRIGGHAGAGTVVAVGLGVERVRVGDRVVVAPRPMCGQCFSCLHDLGAECTNVPTRLLAALADGRQVTATDGAAAFAERMKVSENAVVPVATDLADGILAGLGGDVGAGIGAALMVAGIEPGATVVVVGGGVYGLSVVQAAKLAAAGRIVVIESIAARRDLARQLGASDVVDPTATEPLGAVRELTEGRGADTVFDAVGDPQIVAEALSLTRSGGTAVLADLGQPDGPVTVAMADLAMRSKRLVSAPPGGTRLRRDVPRFVGLVERGDIDVGRLISGQFALGDVGEMLEGQARGEVLGAVVTP